MKRLVLTLFAAALATAGIGTAAAQRDYDRDRDRDRHAETRRDVARVVDVDPLPRRGRPGRIYQQCWNERYDRYDDGYYRDEDGRLYREKDDGTAGAVIGAIVGGVLGNQVGSGRGRTAATVAGAAAGAAIGKDIDEDDRYYRNSRGIQTRCRDVAEYRGRGRPGAFRVTYVYAGQTYNTITRQHPGRTLPVVVEVRPQSDYVADYRD